MKREIVCAAVLCLAALSGNAQDSPRVRVYAPSVSTGSYLGVGLAEIDASRAKDLKLKEERGVEITHVEEGSPAEKAGLKKGDVVLEFNGQRVEGMEQFSRFVRETPAGREVKLLISREGNTQTVPARVAARKTRALKEEFGFTPGAEIPEIRIPDLPRSTLAWQSPILGIEAESIDGQLAEFFGVKQGVLVRGVNTGSAAEKAGLKAGDVITKVDDLAVRTPADISAALRSVAAGKTAQLSVTRDRKTIVLPVTVETRRTWDDAQRGRARRL
jgi:serine protease Do